jgi:crotonobetainyl-CoA:carnitine CoA-transferase CaiB-like acyl-CoA transferase
MNAFITEYDVGADPFLRPDEFLDHPQMTENGRTVTLNDGSRQPGPLVTYSATPGQIGAPAPNLGQSRPADGQAARQTDPRPGASADTRDASETCGRAAAGPLAGVTIIELAYFLAAPLGATLLADLGARVIKVEPLTGDPFRRVGLEFVHLVKGKESLAVDLKSEAGRAIVHRLVGRADAVVHSFRPGVPERLGIDYQTLHAINPQLVYLYAASYGSAGPQAHRAAFHSTPNALCGAGIIQAGVGNQPVDNSWPDPSAALSVAVALSTGLLARDRFGVGQYLETTMLASAAYVHANDILATGDQETRVDSGQHGADPLYRLYPCRSGWLFLAAARDAEFAILATELGRADWLAGALATSPGRRVGADALAAELAAIFAAESADHWERRLTARGIGAVSAADRAFEEFLVEADLLRAGHHPEFGEFFSMPPRVRLDDFDADLPPCACGEHTNLLLGELGYSAAERAELAELGVVRDAGLSAGAGTGV